MRYFINNNFKKADCTTVKAITIENNAEIPEGNWSEIEELEFDILDNCDKLYRQGSVCYYGRL